MIDKDDCSVYAVAFLCSVEPDVARYWLWRAGRRHRDGATDKQIAATVRKLGYNMRRIQVEERTIRTFARSRPWGKYLVTTADHVVAVVDGNVCQREHDSDLMRIEKVHQILKKSV